MAERRFIPGARGRTVEFSPYDLSSLEAWYSADRLGATDLDTISAWPDSSPNGHDLATFGSELGGQYHASDGPNGRPTVRYSGTNQALQSAAFTAISQPFHTFGVYRIWQHSNANILFDLGDTSSAWCALTSTPGEIYLYAGSIGANDTGLVINDYMFFDTLFNGASSSLTINNNTPTACSVGANAMARITMGSRVTGGNNAKLEMCEWVICNDEVTTTELASIRAYFADKYGVTTP